MVTPIATDMNNFPEARLLISFKTAGTTDGFTDRKITSDFLTTGKLSVIASAPKDYNFNKSYFIWAARTSIIIKM